MAIIRTNPTTGKTETMTDKQIKNEIQDLTGWTTSEYQRQYDKFRNRLRNYESIIKSNDPAKANEEFLRIIRKQAIGHELTGRQEAILNITTASTSTIRKQVERGTLSANQNQTAINGVKATFKQLINKSPTTRNALENYLNEKVGERREIGANGQVIIIDILRSSQVTAEEVKEFLNRQAKDLHERQRRELAANGALYQGKKKKSGTD